MNCYLKRRGHTFYVRKRVPAHLRDVIGRDEIVRTLGTTDRKLAQRRLPAVYGRILDEIEAAAERAAEFPSSTKWVKATARAVLRDVEDGTLDREAAAYVMHDTIDRHLKALSRDPDELSDIHAMTLRSTTDLVNGTGSVLLSQAIEMHLEEKDGRVIPSTMHTKRRELEAFAEWLRGDLPMDAISRREASGYVTHLAKNGKAETTNKYSLSVLSAFQRWAIRRGLYEKANPWEGLGEDLRTSKRGNARVSRKRRPWTTDELRLVVDSLPADDIRLQVALLSLYSGMRLNEVCHLEVSEVNLEDGFMALPEGKTESSVRQVPIHPVIHPLVERLKADAEQAEDRFLLPGLKEGGYDRKRGSSLGKRFGRYIRKLGIIDPAVVFHSLRNTFMQACENAGVPESSTQLIVGHARQSLTYGLYSPGADLEVLQKAVSKVTYGEVDEAVSNALEQ